MVFIVTILHVRNYMKTVTTFSSATVLVIILRLGVFFMVIVLVLTAGAGITSNAT